MTIDKLSLLLDEILDDLSSRFIINLPAEELSSVTRICFGLEQAHWFYEDFYRPKYPKLPSVSLRAFTAALFSHCPLLWKFSGEHEAAFDDFLKYKIRVPVRGAIMLNEEMNKCVLVKGWKSSSGWGFPKGKIDKDESDHDCAVREVKEECGFDITPYLDEDEYLDIIMKEQRVRLYVARNVPEDTHFAPQTRKEISKISWFTLNDLPTFKTGRLEGQPAQGGKDSENRKFYMVVPFLNPLRNWIKRKQGASACAKVKSRRKSARDKNDKVEYTRKSDGLFSAAKTSGVDSEMDAEADVELEIENKFNETIDYEASSQALKLLLGVVQKGDTANKNEQQIHTLASADQSKEKKIDLLSLLLGNPVDQPLTIDQVDEAPRVSDRDLNLLAGEPQDDLKSQAMLSPSTNMRSTTLPDKQQSLMDLLRMSDNIEPSQGLHPQASSQQRPSEPSFTKFVQADKRSQDGAGSLQQMENPRQQQQKQRHFVPSQHMPFTTPLYGPPPGISPQFSPAFMTEVNHTMYNHGFPPIGMSMGMPPHPDALPPPPLPTLQPSTHMQSPPHFAAPTHNHLYFDHSPSAAAMAMNSRRTFLPPVSATLPMSQVSQFVPPLDGHSLGPPPTQFHNSASKENANASSLLAILNPNKSAHAQAFSTDDEKTSMSSPPRDSSQSNVAGHKDSLLALLKSPPATTNVALSSQKSEVNGPSFHGQESRSFRDIQHLSFLNESSPTNLQFQRNPRTSSQDDSFLLDYLTKAVGGL